MPVSEFKQYLVNRYKTHYCINKMSNHSISIKCFTDYTKQFDITKL